jgi:hypothetical protein
MNLSGPILFILIVAVLLAAGLAWVVAWMYQRRMLSLMHSGSPAGSGAPAAQAALPVEASPGPWGASVDLTVNRRAHVRLMLVIGGLALLIGVTQSTLALRFIYTGREFSLNRILVLGAVYAWPMVLGWGMARRWSWLRTLAGVAFYMVAMALLVMWRSNTAQTLASVSGWLAGVVAIPMIVALLVGASGRIRAVAPYLLPATMLLAGSSEFALQVMASTVEHPPAWLISVMGAIGASQTMLLMILLPWLLVAWPVTALGRKLAEGYRAKRFSDLTYLIGAYWFVILFASAVPAVGDVGATAFVELLAWLWIPLPFGLLRRTMAPPGDPPTLLVLRVFQHDVQVEKLFDQVIERWRLTGNTVLIAGTDLLSRTLDPDDLFSYFSGHLADRFVADEASLSRTLAELDLRPDPDGRYRANELYCFDSTWQAALAALVQRAHVVLMDLRGFQPNNQGCRHELGVLARAASLERVVVLHDAHTARQVAESDMAGAPAGRFVWQEAGGLSQSKVKEILADLMGPTGSPGSRQNVDNAQRVRSS